MKPYSVLFFAFQRPKVEGSTHDNTELFILTFLNTQRNLNEMVQMTMKCLNIGQSKIQLQRLQLKIQKHMNSHIQRYKNKLLGK